MQDPRVQCHSKLAKDIVEGDVIQVTTGDGHKYYYMDTDAQFLIEPPVYETYVYVISEEELAKYFFDSDISFRDKEDAMLDTLNLGDGYQQLTCLG